MKHSPLLLVVTLLLTLVLGTSCNDKEPPRNSAFTSSNSKKSRPGDLEQIRNEGELIAVTLSGPDTYYEAQGLPMGRQYALAADFARSEGLRLRMEMAHDTTEMVRMLRNGEADIIALPLSRSFITRSGLAAPASPKTGKRKKATDDAATLWAVRPEARELRAALERWRATPRPTMAQQADAKRTEEFGEVKREVRAPWVSRERGIISEYDNLFRSAAETTGWDWRLIAAQCYQESGFDPDALSSAGARGLMQVMPATAKDYGTPAEDLTVPEKNVAVAAKIIHDLYANKFNDIEQEQERIRFVLAAYNCGAGHVRDAMKLTQKNGGNPQRWEDVSTYLLRLSEPRYYRDPVVAAGFLRDSRQPYDYVKSVVERCIEYGGNVAPVSQHDTPERMERISPPPAPNRNDL